MVTTYPPLTPPQEGGGLNFPPDSGGIEGGGKTAKGRYYSGYKGVCLSSYRECHK